MSDRLAEVVRKGACAALKSEYVPRLIQAAKQRQSAIANVLAGLPFRKGNPGHVSPLPEG
jgi:hypothetical protein